MLKNIREKIRLSRLKKYQDEKKKYLCCPQITVI